MYTLLSYACVCTLMDIVKTASLSLGTGFEIFVPLHSNVFFCFFLFFFSLTATLSSSQEFLRNELSRIGLSVKNQKRRFTRDHQVGDFLL